MVLPVASQTDEEALTSDACPGYPSVVGALEDTETDESDVAPAEERILRA